MALTLLSSTILQPGINVLAVISIANRYLVLRFKGETVASSAYRGDLLLCTLIPSEPPLPESVLVESRHTVFYGNTYFDAYRESAPASVLFWVPPSSRAPGRILETCYFS